MVLKKAVVTEPRHYLGPCQEELGKLTETSARIVGVRAESRTVVLPSTILKRSREVNLLNHCSTVYVFCFPHFRWRSRDSSVDILSRFRVFFFNLHSGGSSPNWVHSARRPLTVLLYPPRVIVRMENLVEWMAEETEVLGENLPWRHLVHHKSHLTRPGIEPGPPRWEASD
jgi:hypothetical protein